MKYTKRKPCKLCPFRNDGGRLYVPPDRLREFASQAFVCHETAALDEDDDDGGYVPRDDGKSQHCAGSLIFHEHMGAPNQMMRIAERLGFYNYKNLDMTAPVFKSWEEVEEAEKECKN
jgi:hypothetical protein